MAGSLNKAMLIGRLGADPDMKTGKTSGKRFAIFRLATSKNWRDKETGERKEHTDWHSIVVFNEKLAEIAERYLKKGSLVYVVGEMQTRAYEGQDGTTRYTTEVILPPFGGELTMLEPKGSNRPPEPEDYPDPRSGSEPTSGEAVAQPEQRSSSASGSAATTSGREFSEDEYRRASGG